MAWSEVAKADIVQSLEELKIFALHLGQAGDLKLEGRDEDHGNKMRVRKWSQDGIWNVARSLSDRPGKPVGLRPKT
jgi:hypothetical protein